MSIIKKEDVIGYETKDGVYCANCMETTKDLTEDEVLLESERDEDKLYFCDNCKKQF
jgi:hypothetical protein